MPKKPMQITPTTQASTRWAGAASRVRKKSTPSMAPWRNASATPNSTAQMSRARVVISLQSAGDSSMKRVTTCQKPTSTAASKNNCASRETNLNSAASAQRNHVICLSFLRRGWRPLRPRQQENRAGLRCGPVF